MVDEVDSDATSLSNSDFDKNEYNFPSAPPPVAMTAAGHRHYFHPEHLSPYHRYHLQQQHHRQQQQQQQLQDQHSYHHRQPKQQLSLQQPAESQSKSRKRKRQLHNAIREQMHFYFGDANLSKDRFLKQLIGEDPFVPLDVFMSFNRIKNLTNSVRDIEIAVSTSELLQLSGDRKAVRRVTDVVDKKDTDECTIYVESIPASATHDWIRNIFETYGSVAYVSLPKYRSTGKLKEFGFVEFDDKASVPKAVEAFKKLDCYFGCDDTEPEELCSISSYLKEQKEETQELVIVDETQPKNAHTEEEEEVTACDPDQTPTNDENTEANSSDADSLNFDDGPSKRLKLDNIVSLIDENVNLEMDEPGKKRNRHKKVSDRKKKQQTFHVQESTMKNLRITTKCEWKRLRNKYLNEQRELVKSAKKQYYAEKKLPPSTQQIKRKPKKNAVQISRNMNFYGANRDNDSSPTPFNYVQPIINPVERKPLFSYEPGTIVKVMFEQPLVDVKEFKAEMRQYAIVKYVDVKEGDTAAHIRVDTARSAPTLIKHVAPKRCKILIGETAEAYWEKINRDREQKLTKSIKIKTKRGRERLLEKIPTHIRFDE